jgi:cytochrome c556
MNPYLFTGRRVPCREKRCLRIFVLDNDAVIKAQAIAQTYLGQTKITKELTFAIADLGASMGGDLNAAAEKIGRTIGTTTNAFAKQGLQMDETATTAEKTARVLEYVSGKAGGLAAEFNKADGYSKALGTAFGNLQEEIGARFAPVVAGAREIMVKFFETISENPVLVDMIASLITAGVVVAGLGAAIAAAVPIFSAITAAAATFGVTLNAAFVGIPLLIGAVVAGLTFLALNWDKSMAYIKSISTGVVTFLSEVFGGLGSILKGAFTFDLEKIKAGLAQITSAFAKAKSDAGETFRAVTAEQAAEIEKQDEQKKAQADKQAEQERRHQALLRQIRQAEIDLLKLQNENASKDLIDLKSKEIETLKALNEQKSEAELSALSERLSKIQALEADQRVQDFEREQAFEVIKQETRKELQLQGIQTTAELRDAQLATIEAQAKTEADIERQLQADMLTSRINARNQELLDRKKYGQAIAVIQKAITSDEVKGFKDASQELVALQQSKSETLKSIGKAAAVANITISTAEAAMNIYKGFATIPIIGPALGVAGAAAAVAFGAERISQVTAAADGGLIEGGVQGRDSVPALLMPGELVVPRRNFNDVVGAVQNQGESNSPEVLAELKLMNEKLNNVGNYVFNGDISTDEAFVDNFVKKISDAIEFRNAKVYGVNT